MNDEEKKAIEYLKLVSNVATNKYTMKEQLHFKTILNLIEKQSKEIEELKEKEKNLLIQLKDSEKELLEVCEKLRNSVSKDKIKAKIEELDKEEKEKLKGTKGQDRYVIKQEYMYKRSSLQSILDKIKGDDKI